MPESAKFSEILCNYAAGVFIDDIRWKEELARNAAQFFRLKSLYVHTGVAQFTKPPIMQKYLAYTDCAYADFYYTAATAQSLPLTIATYKTGYEMSCVGLCGKDKFGNPYYTPVKGFTYDKETGDIVISGLPNGLTELPVNQTVQIDFYTDGIFTNFLSERVKRILGLCIGNDWYANMTNSYLAQTQKVADPSFTIKSENEWIRVTTERRRLMREELDAEMRSYEQDCAYTQTVNPADYLQPVL